MIGKLIILLKQVVWNVLVQIKSTLLIINHKGSLDQEHQIETEMLVLTFNTSYLDYCNALLYGILKFDMGEMIQNVATCVVTRT